MNKDYTDRLLGAVDAVLNRYLVEGADGQPRPLRYNPIDYQTLKRLEEQPGSRATDIAAQLGDTIKRIDGTDPVPTWGPVKAVTTRTAPAPEPANEPVEPQKAEPEVATDPDAPSEDDKPELLTSARDGAPDDLKKIKGVGPKLEKLCNDLGVWHFDQIASWTDAEVAWVDYHLEGFKGRISRDGWVAQARAFAAEAQGKD